MTLGTTTKRSCGGSTRKTTPFRVPQPWHSTVPPRQRSSGGPRLWGSDRAVRHLTYLAVLGGCLAGALWLEPILRVGVVRRWRRLALTVLPVAVAFVLW